MGRGGVRQGAGRKSGSLNQSTAALRALINAPAIVHALQDIALGKVAATTAERLAAARTLLGKVLGDATPSAPPPPELPPSLSREQVMARAEALLATRAVVLKKPMNYVEGRD